MNMYTWQDTVAAALIPLNYYSYFTQNVHVHVHLALETISGGVHLGETPGKEVNWIVAIPLIEVQNNWMDWGCPCQG